MSKIKEVSQRDNVTTTFYESGTLRNYIGYIPEIISAFIRVHEAFADPTNNRTVYYNDNNPGSDPWFGKKIPGPKE